MIIFYILFIFILSFNVIINYSNGSLVDYFSILFMNYKQYANFNISLFSPKYIIAFIMIDFILFNFISREVLESPGYLSLITYRKGFTGTIKELKRQAIKKIYFHLLFIGLIMIIGNKLLGNFIFIDCNVCMIYLIRYGFVIFNQLQFYEYMAFCSNSMNGVLISQFVYIGMYFFDLLFHTSFVCFSANLFIELIYLLIELLLVIIFYVFVLKKLINRRDIL